tara:strand:+ start:1434 stop:1736 length:303 start_codon:yes stop_codon:yes gene_type:complete
MREVYLSDLTAAARVLLSVPSNQRVDLCAQMLMEADWADKFTKRMGKPHRHWGNGTLMAAARTRRLLPERGFADPDYASCYMLVFQSLQRHRAAKACKSQ